LPTGALAVRSWFLLAMDMVRDNMVLWLVMVLLLR